MKRIYIILICLGVVLAMHVHAQQLAEQPRHDFRSTSTMRYSGTQLPMAAETGVQTTWSSATSKSPYRPRKAGEWEDDPDPLNPMDPFPEVIPIGDAWWLLMLCALGYASIRILRKRKREVKSIKK